MHAAAILAGGRATRLGGALKPLLVVGGRRIVDLQLAVLRPLFGDIVLVTNEPAPFVDIGVPLIPDRQPGKGPLAGIDAALAHFSGADAVVCVAGDMPFLNAALLRFLRDAPPSLALVPHVNGRPDPLCARYGRAFAAHVSAALEQGRLAVHSLLAQLPADYVNESVLRRLDPLSRAFTNINTPEDLLAANTP